MMRFFGLSFSLQICNANAKFNYLQGLLLFLLQLLELGRVPESEFTSGPNFSKPNHSA